MFVGGYEWQEDLRTESQTATGWYTPSEAEPPAPEVIAGPVQE